MKIVSIMPIKLNNERLPGKNTRLLGKKPLISYMLETLLSFELMEAVYVFCSDSSIKDYLPEGVTYLERPTYLDLPRSNFNQIFDEFIKYVDADIYVYAHATAPFVSVGTIAECVEAVGSGRYDSAFCATKIQDFLWSDGKPLNFNAENLPRSQDLTPIYRETSGIYVIPKLTYQALHRRVGDNPYIKEVSFIESIDINEPDDFRQAELLLSSSFGGAEVMS